MEKGRRRHFKMTIELVQVNSRWLAETRYGGIYRNTKEEWFIDLPVSPIFFPFNPMSDVRKTKANPMKNITRNEIILVW